MHRYMGMSASRNRDLTQAEVPISGFGEVETTVLTSLGSLRGAPEPCPTNAPKPARKVCRIFSPVAPRSEQFPGGRVPRMSNADCQQDALSPLTIDTVFHCPRSTENTSRAGVDTSSVEDHGGGSKHVYPRPQADRRPISSDSSNHSSGRNSYRLDFDTRVDLRPSTTGKPKGQPRRHHCVQHDRLANQERISATRNAVGGDTRSPAKETSKKNRVCRRDSRRRPNASSSGSDRRSSPWRDHGKGDQLQPNHFWPTVGGPKAFLRPFIQRNQRHLWVYDPALVGMDHLEACRYIVGKGNFESTKRVLAWKENALTKSTGSLQANPLVALYQYGKARSGLKVYGHVGEGRGKVSENWQGKREAEEVDKDEIAPGVDRRKPKVFQSHVDWKDPKTSDEASAAH